MSNVGGRKYYEQVDEVSIPLHDGKATVRDVSDLIGTAQRKLEELRPSDKRNNSDDAFWIEADEDCLKVEFRTEWKP